MAVEQPLQPLLPTTLVTRAAAQSIPTAVSTAVTWDTVTFDSLQAFSAGNPTRLTVPRTGVYDVWLHFAINVGGADFYGQIKLNGGSFVASKYSHVAAGFDGGYPNVETHHRALNTGDYVEAFVYQDAAGAQNLLVTAAFTPFFGLRKVG